ncbi:MAG: 30S ribosomal protein S17 [Alphaproteobacteria bacterium MarineAlpha9_Bin4]|nr:30S ribosomal protein S17 [Pelagibacterales bacterium]PPR26252.1 MAG: 30S ribosomal protein S17 [Alphaproteobacteria bacterium MarineAlpha9_Bin4]|tara:strand:+ start:880 stop:1104 length:225 start_codon:yes stop_codon:yes gene_type:complete
MPKRVLNGIVCSSSNNKTIVVKVERLLKHPIYKKYVKKYKKYHAHDEGNTLKVGDKVSIQETKPISKLKTWVVI